MVVHLIKYSFESALQERHRFHWKSLKSLTGFLNVSEQHFAFGMVLNGCF
jgi:hypothetical protein